MAGLVQCRFPVKGAGPAPARRFLMLLHLNRPGWLSYEQRLLASAVSSPPRAKLENATVIFGAGIAILPYYERTSITQGAASALRPTPADHFPNTPGNIA